MTTQSVVRAADVSSYALIPAESARPHFPTGPDGAHGVSNETDERVRFLMASTLHSPEVVEYPDLGQITAQARTGSQTGERLWLIHDVEPPARP
jgi:uncharacterized cupin superfamily protein